MTRFQKRLLLGIAVLAAIIAVQSFLWFQQADRLKGRAEAWIADHHSQGPTVAAQSLTVEGYPFRLGLRLTGLLIENVPRLPGIRIEAPVVTVSGVLWGAHHWRLGAETGFALAGPSGATATVTAAAGRLNVVDPQTELTLTLENLSLAVPGPWDGLTVPNAALHLSWDREGLGTEAERPPVLDVAVDRLTLPVDFGSLPRVVDHFGFTARLQGPVAPGALRPALTAWRDHGGTIEVSRLELDWASLTVRGDGTVAFDETLQPMAAFATRFSGWEPLLHGLVSSGVLTEPQGNFIGAGLALLAHKGQDGVSYLKTPLTIQHGQLALGPAKLLPIPPIAWE
jgi:hypothetical protein